MLTRDQVALETKSALRVAPDDERLHRRMDLRALRSIVSLNDDLYLHDAYFADGGVFGYVST